MSSIRKRGWEPPNAHGLNIKKSKGLKLGTNIYVGFPFEINSLTNVTWASVWIETCNDCCKRNFKMIV